ncbi:PAMP-induced secreted peptide 2 [Mercurialis annua]|uniref:PAMP-induced secreted peptide 2 n=1 Tax=Mercurialis annua TaxID=3986 RepID=UPI002160985F|nr:PAMP-induced secreted peptide 2 [Mercurialis annua]
MAKESNLFSLFFVLLIVLAGISTAEARPLNMLELDKGLFDGLCLGAIKQSGPSPGVGNKFTDSRSFGAIKHDGPSPGQGH